MTTSCFAVLVLAALILLTAQVAANLKLEVQGDTRRDIDLGTFGYGEHGEFALKVNEFFIDDTESFVGEGGIIHHNEPIGFVLDPVSSAQAARIEKNYAKTTAAAQRKCFIHDPLLLPKDPSMRKIFSLNGKNLKELTSDMVFKASITAPSLYALFFYNCKGFNDTTVATLKPVAVTFVAEATMYNVDTHGQKNFLGVGQQSFPLLYGFFAFVFIGLSVLWGRQMMQNPVYVQSVHKIMLFLVIVKALSLLFESIKFSHYASTGTASIWDAFYYVFLSMKGITLFAVILLLGSGWSILKAFLSEQDKKVLMVIIPSQVVVNICLAIIEETSEGNKSWSTWSDLLRILDVVCCCCVLLPIVWSMRNLRDAASQDGKAAQTLSRMRLFRTFYLVIVAYIYFTRIVLVMVEGTVPYTKLWMARFLREGSAVAFYSYSGYRFRPMKENPYLNLEQEDLEELEARNELEEPGKETNV